MSDHKVRIQWQHSKVKEVLYSLYGSAVLTVYVMFYIALMLLPVVVVASLIKYLFS